MAKEKKSKNPFYVLLVVTGFFFVITCFAFVTTGMRSSAASANGHPLAALVSRYGTTALIVELALLTIGTIGAITTDEYWNRDSSRS